METRVHQLTFCSFTMVEINISYACNNAKTKYDFMTVVFILKFCYSRQNSIRTL